MPNSLEGLVIRPGKRSDIPFIKNSWLKSFRGTYFSGPLPKFLYFQVYSQALDALLHDGYVWVAAEDEDPNFIFGYLVFELDECPVCPPVVHYLFVKETFRQQGIGTALLEKAGINPREEFYFTYQTADASKLTRGDNAPWAGVFKPHLARKHQPAPTTYDPEQEFSQGPQG